MTLSVRRERNLIKQSGVCNGNRSFGVPVLACRHAEERRRALPSVPCSLLVLAWKSSTIRRLTLTLFLALLHAAIALIALFVTMVASSSPPLSRCGTCVFLHFSPCIFLALGNRVLATFFGVPTPSSQRRMPQVTCGPLPFRRHHPKNNSRLIYNARARETA